MATEHTYRNEIMISWPELHRDARNLCSALCDLGDWQGIIAIARGGLVPAALVARELDIRLLDTVCLESYGRGALRGPNRCKARSIGSSGSRAMERAGW